MRLNHDESNSFPIIEIYFSDQSPLYSVYTLHHPDTQRQSSLYAFIFMSFYIIKNEI